jgi:hypothetical protein
MLKLSDDHDRLSAIAGYILAHKLEVVTNRDVARGDRTMRGLTKPETMAAFEQLEALGWLVRTPGRRPSSDPQWQVNPAVHIKFEERAAVEAERRAKARDAIVSLVAASAAPADNADKTTEAEAA